jgi:hypothetical protein
MTEEQGKKLIAYVKELAQQHNALEAKVKKLEDIFRQIGAERVNELISGTTFELPGPGLTPRRGRE